MYFDEKIGEHFWLDICIWSPQLIAWLFSNDRPGPACSPSSVSANGGPRCHARTQPPAAAECFNQARVECNTGTGYEVDTRGRTVPSRVTLPIPAAGHVTRAAGLMWGFLFFKSWFLIVSSVQWRGSIIVASTPSPHQLTSTPPQTSHPIGPRPRPRTAPRNLPLNFSNRRQILGQS